MIFQWATTGAGTGRTDGAGDTGIGAIDPIDLAGSILRRQQSTTLQHYHHAPEKYGHDLSSVDHRRCPISTRVDGQRHSGAPAAKLPSARFIGIL